MASQRSSVPPRTTDPRVASFVVLQRRAEISAARQRLIDRGLSSAEPTAMQRLVARVHNLGRRLTSAPDPRTDPIKSWDVELALEAIEAAVDRDEAVLDMGSIGCAILPALNRLGYRNLHGVDLNPQVVRMPDRDVIDYSVQDMTATNFGDGAFSAITSISAIEHGLDADALLREVARLLRPGGVFLFSTDYWPDKIDTSGVVLFDLSWTIFDADEVTALVRTGEDHGLAPAGDVERVLNTVDERPINFTGRDYTFLFGALTRTA
jgi:2-polyprenyl-3-methyl-5-hydroxy-6-metoxy-1,4-benzoquinol methylase